MFFLHLIQSQKVWCYCRRSSIRFKNGHVVGYFQDQPQKLARSVLAIMVPTTFVFKELRICYQINSCFSINFSIIASISILTSLCIIHTADGESVFLMTDYHSTNQTLHKLLLSSSALPTYVIQHPMDEEKLFLLFDLNRFIYSSVFVIIGLHHLIRSCLFCHGQRYSGYCVMV